MTAGASPACASTAGASLARASAAVAFVALAGCATPGSLSGGAGTVHREFGELQDRSLLLNIVRRSAGLPAHFVSLRTVRGRQRFSVGAHVSLPLGADAPARFDLEPNLSTDQGPSFEMTPQDNKEFYQGYLAPVGVTTARTFLRQDIAPELILSLLIESITVRSAGGERHVVNTPDQPRSYAAFQSLLEELVDEGLWTEQAELFRDVGPAVVRRDGVGFDEIVGARDKGLVLEEEHAASSHASDGAPRRYRLREIFQAVRFCFRHPKEPLYANAQCQSAATGTAVRRFRFDDPRFFGTVSGAVAALAVEGEGELSIRMRSLSEILDFLGEAVREQLEGRSPPNVRTPGGRQPVLVVRRDASSGPLAISVEFGGARYSVPAGEARGQSGAVITVVSQLLAQAQSIRDLPASSTVTIVSD